MALEPEHEVLAVALLVLLVAGMLVLFLPRMLEALQAGILHLQRLYDLIIRAQHRYAR